MLRERKIPTDNLRRADKLEPGRCQRWHVQSLANMAGGVGALGVFVQETAARGEIQQRGASQQRQSPAHHRSPSHDSHQIHNTEHYLSTLPT